jgi:hypothetical protein
MIAKNKIDQDIIGQVNFDNLDDIGYMSSWARPFFEHYKKFVWTASFGCMNGEAMAKMIRKISKHFFTVPDNHILRAFEDRIKQLEVTTQPGAETVRKDLRNKFSYQFTGDEQKARLILEAQMKPTNTEDVGTIAFMSGMILSFSVVTLCFLTIPDKDSNFHIYEIQNILPAY